ncbi:LCP family protein [Arthrobacter sp. zg-Y820]|uniref:LCP family protein n=1 Tax=unclassified Arthrobacter TaxID=235627 RepID=UPI001E514DDB|nr:MULTISPECIES: LCP family protein [unclassified Arthrobacter]MCC9196486.1 LCP family protein [Arthrobacter sp. zg-Y820]MDK1279348.1 LCP family protein [Arthrobacter sp. zg.Y820]WIB08266.1 LCP family protein [Arthrobacter sp. zg-Y820]
MSSRRAVTGAGPSGNSGSGDSASGNSGSGDSASGPAPAGNPGGRHLGRHGAAHPVLRAVAVILALTLVSGLAFVGVQVVRLQNNLDTKPLNLGASQEAAVPVDTNTDPLQILILGTDNREGQESNNSDVMMLANMSADRSHVTVVSFPRDLLVPLPECSDPDTGNTYPAMDLGQLNGALGNGGPGCTVAAINELTGLNIDHFMMADFDAVKELSDTLGGVEVCVNQPVEDELSGLSLPAGVSSVQGDQALAFLRTRHGFGNGGDEGRIRAQQSFMASMVRKVQDEGTLKNLPKLYSIAETVTQNLTVDKDLTSASSLIALAGRLKDVDLGRVAFVTAPVVPYEYDNNRLVLDEAAAEPLFTALVEDRDITKPAEPETAPGTAPAEGTPPPAEEAPLFDPATIPVTILDATGSADEAGTESRDQDLAAYLLSEGFALAASGGQTGAPSPATQVFHGPGYLEMAQQVAAALGIPAVQVVASNLVIGVSVQVGQDFTTGNTMPDAGDVGGLTGQTAAQVTCQSAFGN